MEVSRTKQMHQWCLEKIPCDDRVKLYISWVARSISPLVVYAQVKVFAITQASKFKSYFENQNSLNTRCTTVVRIEKRRVFLLKNSCAFSAELNFFSWVELFQLSWNYSAELSFFNWVELLQVSWTSSSELSLFSWVELNFNCETLWSKPVELAFGLVQPGLSLQNFLVKTNWMGPRGSSTGL
jgi:hypothetical protein